MQEVLNKAIVELGDLRASMEEVKWNNMRKAVGDHRPLPLSFLFSFSSYSLPRRISSPHHLLHGVVPHQQTAPLSTPTHRTKPTLRSRR